MTERLTKEVAVGHLGEYHKWLSKEKLIGKSTADRHVRNVKALLDKTDDPGDEKKMEDAIRSIPDTTRGRPAWSGPFGFKTWWVKRNQPMVVKPLILASMVPSGGVTRDEVLDHLDEYRSWLLEPKETRLGGGEPMYRSESADGYIRALRKLMQLADPLYPETVEAALASGRLTKNAWGADQRKGFLRWWDLRKASMADDIVFAPTSTESSEEKFLVTDDVPDPEAEVAHRTLPVVATEYDPWEWKAELIALARELDHRGLTSTELEQMSPKEVGDLIRVPFMCGTTKVDPELLSLARAVRYLELGQITPSAVDELLRKLK